MWLKQRAEGEAAPSEGGRGLWVFPSLAAHGCASVTSDTDYIHVLEINTRRQMKMDLKEKLKLLLVNNCVKLK